MYSDHIQINLDYEDDTEPTADGQDDYRKLWMAVEASWNANERKCTCGNLIGLMDYYQHGKCLECMIEHRVSSGVNQMRLLSTLQMR